MRRYVIAAAVSALLAGAAPVATAHAAPARRAADPTAATYVPFATPSRVVDTRNGTGGNRKGSLKPGDDVAAQVAGVGSVPASGVGSVVVTVTAVTPSAAGGLVVYPDGTSKPGVTTLQFSGGQRNVTATTVVALSSAGRIRIRDNQSSGAVHVTVDVSGYHRAGTASQEPGTFHPVTQKRLVDTRSGTGVEKGKVAAGKSATISLGGTDGIPAAPGAVAVTITVLSPTASGKFTAGRPDEQQDAPGYPFAHFYAGQSQSGFAALRVSDGDAYVTNQSGGSVDFVVDVVGYWSLGFAEQAHTFQTRVQTRVLHTSVAANADQVVALGGLGGVEKSGVEAAVVTLHVTSATAAGGLRAWRTGSTPATKPTALQFATGRTSSNVVVVPTTDDGRFTVHNASGRAASVYVEIDGYVPSKASPPITGKATAHYLEGLTGTLDSDLTKMKAYGTKDGAAGYGWILLDVGAQSVSAPILSKAAPGVSIAKTAKRVAYTYSDLVTLIRAYLTALTAALPDGADAPEVAVGTNNDGRDTWDPKKTTTYYAPDARGKDWANDVVEQLTGFGVTVKGANDIEAFFTSTQTQALQWESAYLAAAAVPSPQLYFNGSADGCPTTWTSATCAYGWTPAQYKLLASQPGVVAVPQIYIGSQATQWSELAKASGNTITFAGVLSEYTLNNDRLSPAQTAAAINRGLASVGEKDLPGFVADFQQP